MRKLFICLVTILSTTVSFSQVQETWAISHIKSGLYDQVVDAAGNVYVTGTGYSESLDQGGILTFKYDKNGVEKWRNFYPGTLDPRAMTIDASGNVYIAVWYKVSGHQSHYSVLKLNAGGHFAWFNAYVEDDVFGIPQAIAVDANGDVYITGVSYTAFEPETDFHIDETSADYATVKYRGFDGEEIWARRYNGASPNNAFDGATAMVIDAFNNIYVTGTSHLAGQADIVTIKYTPTGTITWSQRFDEAGLNDQGADIRLDAAGNVIVAGATASASNGRADIRIIKYTFSGFQLWTRRAYNNLSGERRARKVVIDNAGNSIVLAEGHMAILVKYNSTGDQLWLREFDGLGGRQADAATDGSNMYLAARSSDGLKTLKLNSNGGEEWRIGHEASFNDITVERIGVDANQNVYSSTTLPYLTIRYSQCTLTCSGNITVDAEIGKCGATVTYPAATTTGDCGAAITYSHPSGTFFPVGTTTIIATSTETGAECSFTITVADNENPVISTCPSNKSVNTDAGVCYASANSVNAGQAMATDNCSVTVAGVRSDGQALTANYPAGVTTITWTATDASNNTATCTQTITVVDNVPPVISNASVSKTVLTPPNHKMVDVFVNYTVSDNCSATATIDVTSDEPESGLSNGDQGPDIIKIDEHHIQLRAERDGKGDGRVYTIIITARDGSGNVSTATQTVVVAHNITAPHSGAAMKVGSTVNLSGSFWDIAGNKHTAKWLIDDNTTVKGSVTEPAGMKNGSVTGSYKFTAAGVYRLAMNITDQNGYTTKTTANGDLDAIVVIYDPSGGYTYGGGSFYSPAGGLKSNPAITGDVSYGFTINYYKGATLPKGETQFSCRLGEFEFNALNFDYLVINQAMAQFRGTGKITGGQSGIGFTMTVVDGQVDGSGVDKIRMKIYHKNTGAIIYDSEPGASDAAPPSRPVGANSTIVISGMNPAITSVDNNKNATTTAHSDLLLNNLHAVAYPNPSTRHFSINTTGFINAEKLTIQVTDLYGRVVERRMATAGAVIRLGEYYRPGTYFVRLTQGNKFRNIKLVKLSD